MRGVDELGPAQRCSGRDPTGGGRGIRRRPRAAAEATLAHAHAVDHANSVDLPHAVAVVAATLVMVEVLTLLGVDAMIAVTLAGSVAAVSRISATLGMIAGPALVAITSAAIALVALCLATICRSRSGAFVLVTLFAATAAIGIAVLIAMWGVRLHRIAAAFPLTAFSTGIGDGASDCKSRYTSSKHRRTHGRSPLAQNARYAEAFPGTGATRSYPTRCYLNFGCRRK